MLAVVSTSTVTSIPSTLILIVGSISLRFFPVFVGRWPTCTAVLNSFPDYAIIHLLSCHFWVHQAMELEVQDILKNSKVSNGFLGPKAILQCCFKVLALDLSCLFSSKSRVVFWCFVAFLATIIAGALKLPGLNTINIHWFRVLPSFIKRLK